MREPLHLRLREGRSICGVSITTSADTFEESTCRLCLLEFEYSCLVKIKNQQRALHWVRERLLALG